MQSLHNRCLVLIALFSGALLVMGVLGSPTATQPRWPVDDGLFQVAGWTASDATLERANGSAYVTRELHAPDGETAIVTISTSPAAKRIYRAGADVPFLGNGYTVEPAPEELVGDSGRQFHATIARRGDEAWLQLHVYGEHRGQFGNGPLAWGLSVADTIAAAPNDYYIARVLIPLESGDAAAARSAEALAETLFPRIADWYAHA